MKFRLIPLVLFATFSLAVRAEILVSDVRVKAPVPGQTISAGYLHITNSGEKEVVLLGVSSDSAARVEMHTHTMEDGMMGMVKMDSVRVKAGETLSFVEGGHHLMIFEPDPTAIDSGSFGLSFEFNNGDIINEDGRVEHLVHKEHKH